MDDEVRPDPGSDEARKLGCVCPVVDNQRGKGAYIKDGKPQFWIAQSCVVHNPMTNKTLSEFEKGKLTERQAAGFLDIGRLSLKRIMKWRKEDIDAFKEEKEKREQYVRGNSGL